MIERSSSQEGNGVAAPSISLPKGGGAIRLAIEAGSRLCGIGIPGGACMVLCPTRHESSVTEVKLMPARILCWNVNNFLLPKLWAAAQRLNFIVNQIVNGGPRRQISSSWSRYIASCEKSGWRAALQARAGTWVEGFERSQAPFAGRSAIPGAWFRRSTSEKAGSFC